MKFNLAYMGYEAMFHLRRDFFIALQSGLRSLGHEVYISGATLDASAFNLIVGAYALKRERLQSIASSGVQYAHINTEIIAQGMLNYNPDKVDFIGDYLPSMRAGKFVWDVVEENLAEHQRYQTKSHFLRWGWTPTLEDIEHRVNKDLDFYFFGLMSDRRKEIISELRKRGFVGAVDHICPYFMRNDRISRAKVCLNVRQDDMYTHVNSFRICYLANNSCCILAESESDPSGYLECAETVPDASDLSDRLAILLEKDRWRERGRLAYEHFRKRPMKELMAQLLDESF